MRFNGTLIGFIYFLNLFDLIVLFYFFYFFVECLFDFALNLMAE